MCVWNGRGGACVPARTSAQRRFHTKIYLRITYHARGFNDGCALAGRHGRAHRRRPYPSPSYLSVQSTHDQQPLRLHSCNTIHHLEMNKWADGTSIIMFTSDANINFTLPSREIKSCHGMVEIKWFYFRRSPIVSISINTSALRD